MWDEGVGVLCNVEAEVAPVGWKREQLGSPGPGISPQRRDHREGGARSPRPAGSGQRRLTQQGDQSRSQVARTSRRSWAAANTRGPCLTSPRVDGPPSPIEVVPFTSTVHRSVPRVSSRSNGAPRFFTVHPAAL